MQAVRPPEINSAWPRTWKKGKVVMHFSLDGRAVQKHEQRCYSGSGISLTDLLSSANEIELIILVKKTDSSSFGAIVQAR